MEAQRALLPDLGLGPAKPILKWAGGKAQLIRELRACLPKHFGRYVEPFLGGGALFFDLGVPGGLVADSNPELINFYEAVRDDPDGLLSVLRHMVISKEEFYRWRAVEPESLDKSVRAARFLYLNKTCYNGLHRVNKRGQFNTPFGGRTDVRIVDSANLRRACAILRTAEMRCADFADVLASTRSGDFVYLDPPYLPLGGYSDFRRYTREFFGAEDHFRLARAFRALSDRGVALLLSNSAHPTIEALYSGFHMVRVKASRYINCRAEGRGHIAELLIANYPLEIRDVVSGHQIHGQ